MIGVLLIEKTHKDDQHRAFLPAGKVGADAVPLHLESVCHRHCSTTRCSEWMILGDAQPDCEFPERFEENKSSHIVPADSQVTQRSWPGYVPKFPTIHFWDQVVNLQMLPLRRQIQPL